MKNIEIASQILEEIKRSKNVLLHCHPSADADSVGSGLAMMHVLEGMGKNVTVIRGDSDISQAYKIMPGFEKIVAKNFFEVDLASFDLFIIVDSGGLNQISRIAPVVFPEKLKTICIDHHASNNGIAQINLMEKTYPATCQILFDLFENWNITLTPDVAKCLMLGIYADTGGFKFPGTTATTLEAASKLAKIVPDYTSAISYMENTNTPGAVAYEALALSSVALHCQNKVAISTVSYASLQQKKIGKMDLFPDIANTLKSVVGWEIGVKVVEDEPGQVRASFRTRDAEKYDVSKIATALGGGGHKAAAAVHMKISLEEAGKKIVETIGKIFPELAE